MSETLSQDPDGLNVAYTTLAPSYPPTPATPSSTVQDAPPGANLPPFSTFSADMDTTGSYSSVPDRLFGDTRLLDISSWDYYTDGRLLDRSEISSQPQYRPWESKPVDPTSSTGFAPTTPVNTFADAFAHQNGVSKLPSFQSQFQTFSDTVTTSEPTTLTTLTNLTPVSPNSSSSPGSHSLTTLNSNFHTLSAVNPRSYPLVPAPIQAREIPSIQQQFLDERHIQLYSHPTANLATINNTIHSASIFPAQNGATIIQNNHQLIQSPATTVVTVLKSDADLKLTTNHHLIDPTMKTIQNVGLHPTQFQNPMATLNAVAGADSGLYNGLDKKLNGLSAAPMINSPTRNDFRKKERRKIRASSLESSAESDGASSNNNMEIGSENSGQVAAVSSTAGYKSHHSMSVNSSMDMDEISGGNVDKQVKKKRKRCGECIGCQRKDNCGDCAPCRNDKSHQICKQRRCEKLTEKKNLYGDGTYIRGESRRGRGKGRGGGSYRGRKATSAVTASLSSSTNNSVGVNPPETNGGSGSGSSGNAISANQPPPRPSPQPPPPPPPTASAATVQQPMPVQQQPMTPMPFYADPNRFTTPVWQTEAPQVAWAPQGQFIQQIPTATAQPTLETYQQYPNGIYQTTYQQPAFETNTFYTGAVQVLTRPPSTPNQSAQQQQQQLTPRGSYAASSPSQSNNANQNRSQYQEFQNFIPPATTPSSTDANQSRPSSVNSNMNPPTPNNQNFQQQNNQQQQQQQNSASFTTVSTATFSPTSNQTNYVNANSGNAEPGYPQMNSNPQLASHSSSGYPGSGQYNSGGPSDWQQQQQQSNDNQQQQQQMMQQWEQQNEDSAKRYQNDNNVQNEKVFSQSDKVNLNTRIKTMILSKQQQQQQQQQEVKEEENRSNVEQNPTGHFLWFSHHHHLDQNPSGDGGPHRNHQSPKEANQRRLAKDETKIDSANQRRSEPITDETSQKSPDSSSSCTTARSSSCTCSKDMQSQSSLLGCSQNLQNLIDNLESKLRCCLRAGSFRWRIVTERNCNAKSLPSDKKIIKSNQEPLILVQHQEDHSCSKRYQAISIILEESHLSSAIKTESLFSILSENFLSNKEKHQFSFSLNTWSKTAEELFVEEKIQELANTWLVPLLKSLGAWQSFHKVGAVSGEAEHDYSGFTLVDSTEEENCAKTEVQNGQITSTTQDNKSRSTENQSYRLFSVAVDNKGILLDLVHGKIRAKIILKNHNPRQSPEYITLVFD